MKRRSYLLGAAATVLLTAASLAGVALVGPPSWGGAWSPGASGFSECSVPSLPGQPVDVRLGDMGAMMGGRGGWEDRGRRGDGTDGGWMVLQASSHRVSAGTVSFRVVNQGARVHELMVLPLAWDASAGSLALGENDRVDETGSLGEAATDCGTGHGEGIGPGGVSWVTVTLAPGRYELVCNLEGHYAAGMYDELAVT